jgi:hypothetical protein
VSGLVKTFFAVWLCLMGMLHGRTVYTAEPALGDFLVGVSQASDELPSARPEGARAASCFVYDGPPADRYCHNDPVNHVDRLGLESVPVYRDQISQAQGRMGLAEYVHWLDGMAAENNAAKWSQLFSGAEATGQTVDPKLIAAISFLHASGAEARDMARSATMRGAGATIDVANAGINRLYRHAAYLDWAADMAPGSVDPAVDPTFFDDDNPEFHSAEWSRRLVQINPSRTIAREFALGRYGSAAGEFGKEVAIWSAFGLAGEYATAGRVTFGVGVPTGRNLAAMSIRNFQRDMRASGMATADVNSYVRAFELQSFRYGRNFNPFKKYFRHFTAGERAGGPWVHPSKSLLSADSLTRRTLLALPESNLATGSATTRIPFLRKMATGTVAPQPPSFTGLPVGIPTGGVPQVYVPSKPWLDFTIIE